MQASQKWNFVVGWQWRHRWKGLDLQTTDMPLWTFWVVPAPQECPLNLEPKAHLKAYRKATQCDANMGKTFLESSWLLLLSWPLWPLPNHQGALLGRVKTRFHPINNSKNEIWPNKCVPQSLKHIIHLQSSLTHFHIVGKTWQKNMAPHTSVYCIFRTFVVFLIHFPI